MVGTSRSYKRTLRKSGTDFDEVLTGKSGGGCESVHLRRTLEREHTDALASDRTSSELSSNYRLNIARRTGGFSAPHHYATGMGKEFVRGKCLACEGSPIVGLDLGGTQVVVSRCVQSGRIGPN